MNFIESFLVSVITLAVSVTSLSSPSKFNQSITWNVICKNKGYLDASSVHVNPVYSNDYNDDNLSAVQIKSCIPPQTSYAEVLGNIGFDVTSIEYLMLYNIQISEDTPLLEHHFSGLFIKKVFFKYFNSDIETFELDFIRPLPNLTSLVVYGAAIKPSPSFSRIVDARFFDAKFLDNFGACDELERLKLWQWEVGKEDILASCPKLTHLHLSYVARRSIAHVIKNTYSVTHLVIEFCFLRDLKRRTFFHLTLTYLQLNNNYLKNVNLISPMPFLQELHIPHNYIVAEYQQIVQLFKNVPQLRVLDISFNDRFDFCTEKNTVDSEILHPLLERLEMDGTITNMSCLDVGAFPSLKYLNLKEQNIVVLQFSQLQVSKVALRVNLRGNDISEVNFTEIDYNYLRAKQLLIKGAVILLDGTLKLDCDCRNAWFATALRERLVLAPEAFCEGDSNKYLTSISAKQFECDKFPCSGCTCRLYWENNFLEVSCGDVKFTNIPNVTGVKGLIAPFNQISLRSKEIPDTLTYLDLRNNEIVHIDEEVTKELFSVADRQILLAGNPLLCTCEHFAFIQAVQNFSHQVKDYEDVACAGNDTLLKDVKISALCRGKEAIEAVIATGVTVLAIAVLIAAVYFRYGSLIYMFMYTRGWLCCINEDQLDANRIYDVFLSYCHEDGSVVDDILTWLEDRGFKVCVHYRDWMPGEMIPTQIVRSVEVSRRTVILLSKHYTDSMWGILEFRTAHSRALKEGVMRVILVVLDDVIDNGHLDEDLRRYIMLNTYVRFDDPWFWDKLLYAMPRRRDLTPLEPMPVGDIALGNLPAIVDEPFVHESVVPTTCEPVVSFQSRIHSLEDVASS